MTRLIKIGNNYELFAEAFGLRLTKVQSQTSSDSTGSAAQFLASLSSLKADGIFEQQGNDFVADLSSLLELESREIDPLCFILEWSPFVLRIEGKGALGFDDFRFTPRFYLGKRVVQIRTLGIMGWRNQTIYRLPAAQALALSLVEHFNNSTPETKQKAQALDHLYQLKILAGSNSGIHFDDYLNSENVVKPSAVGLNAQDDGRRAIVYPVVEGVSEDVLKKQFLNISEVQDVYDIDPGNGQSRQRLIISSELKEILKTIKKKGFGITGETREAFYRNPRSLLPEGGAQNPDLISLIGFGPRVKGIGYAAFARATSVTTNEKWFGDEPKSKETKSANRTVAIECTFVDGESQLIQFENEAAASEFVAAVTAGVANGNTSIQWEEMSIPISAAFAASLADQTALNNEVRATEKATSPLSKRLLIHTNEETLDYSETTSAVVSPFKFEMPKGLIKDLLKDYQRAGVGWMAGLIKRDLAKGALLADDMGLGKTLQILTFLAWCIEDELQQQLGKPSGPYDPILIVAPLILLDNWEKEIKHFFETGLFSPFEKLHGSALKAYRKAGSSGRETEPSTETLDIEVLRRNRVIITNYETVKNYQYTFAKVPWSIVVIDEAQEIKEASTAVTYALKVLNPIFRVASTGTPVETSLSNLWSIMDFAQPGNALGTLKSFNKEFGNFSYDNPELGQRLRQLLKFNAEDGLILRRSKKDVLKDLPTKTVVEHFCEMDDDISNKYQSVIQSVQSSTRGSPAALQGLHQISQISQHPFLIEGEPFRSDHREYLKASSKLRKLVSLLKEIKDKNEKALVFTRSRSMQDILKAVIDEEFKLDVGIVNGDTASRHKYVSNTREGIIKRFSTGNQFNALILSPEVAGVGLTITAANHVIHYGRWWNPAKENQATDRAYRIGQTKPVYVHHLILKDPKNILESFDEKLHRLLKTREDLADNFLAPAGDEKAIQEDLFGNMFRDPGSTASSNDLKGKPQLSRLTPFEFECASALLFQTRCKDVFVTSKAGDRGIDVIGISEKEIILIQCKKTDSNQTCPSEALDELIDGADYYREHVVPRTLKHLPIKLILMTTGRADKSLTGGAIAKGIELIDGLATRKMYETFSLTSIDLNGLDSARPTNIDLLTLDLAKRYGRT